MIAMKPEMSEGNPLSKERVLSELLQQEVN